MDRIPREMIPDEDIQVLSRVVGRKVRLDEKYVYLRTGEIDRLCSLVEQNRSLPSEVALAKSVALRAASVLLRYVREAQTPGDKAAIVAAALSLYQISPSMASRVMSIMAGLR